MAEPPSQDPAQLVAQGNVLRVRGDGVGAVKHYLAALEIDPDHFEACNNLGVIYLLSGKLDEATRLLQKAVAAKPDGVRAWSNLGNALMQSGRAKEAVAACRRAVEIDPTFAGARSNLVFFLTFDPDASNEAIYDEHRRWAQIHADPLIQQSAPHPNDRTPGRRLRVGYVSADFREHAVAHFIEPLFRAHDPREVEVYGFADVAHPDQVTARLRGLVHRWQDISTASDEELAASVRAQQIDILVDLAGYTHGGRLLAFARRPAPVQVAYLGYPNTTGMRVMDYRVVDAHTDPPGMTEPLWTEQLVRLPRTFACYQPPPKAPEVNALPADTNGHVTFGSFAMLSKLNERLIASWCRILNQVPGSRFFTAAGGLQEPAIADRFRAAFIAHGIDPSRLEFSGNLSFANYLAAHHRIDLLLDSFPVNGHTVSCHALWMGVPFVSLEGASYRCRLGASVLHNIDLADLLADAPEEYERKAIALAQDRPRLASLRSTLRSRMKASPLCNAREFARDVEIEYRTMWKRWCSSTSPNGTHPRF